MSTWSEIQNNPRLKNIFDARSIVVKLIREFFWSRNFIEVETPIAVRLASQEPYLNPLPVSLHDPRGSAYSFYLRTSPEYALKKLLAAGYEKIFEIGKCFRDYENFGGNHNTEFTMIEWYRAPGTYQEIMDDTENLFKFVGTALQKDCVFYKNKQIPITQAWDRLSMRAIWQRYIGINLDDYLTLQTMAELAVSRGFAVDPADAYEDVFYKIFLNEIESQLGIDRPVFIYDYPACMTSLSRLSDDVRYAQRFELYIGGLEIANAFGELTDHLQQQKNLEADRQKRTELGKEVWPVDPDFISALQSGIGVPKDNENPGSTAGQAGGIALGVDRMVVLFTGAQDISEVIFQSIKDQMDI